MHVGVLTFVTDEGIEPVELRDTVNQPPSALPDLVEVVARGAANETGKLIRVLNQTAATMKGPNTRPHRPALRRSRGTS